MTEKRAGKKKKKGNEIPSVKEKRRRRHRLTDWRGEQKSCSSSSAA